MNYLGCTVPKDLVLKGMVIGKYQYFIDIYSNQQTSPNIWKASFVVNEFFETQTLFCSNLRNLIPQCAICSWGYAGGGQTWPVVVPSSTYRTTTRTPLSFLLQFSLSTALLMIPNCNLENFPSYLVRQLTQQHSRRKKQQRS